MVAKKKNATALPKAASKTQRMLAELNKAHGAGTFVTAMEARANIKQYINSGLPVLNLLLTGVATRGFPVGRIYELYGEPHVGKSTLMCLAMAQCQRQMDGLGCFIDTEGTMTRDRMLSLGIDESSLLICQEIWAENVLHQIELVIEKCGKTPAVIAWDTVASTRSKAHDGAEIGRGRRAALASALSEGMAMLVPTVAKSNAILIACNQKRSGAVDGNPYHTKRKLESTKGGEALKFHAGARIRVDYAGDYYRSAKGVKSQYGFVSRVTMTKNKLVPNDIEAKLIFQSKGVGSGRFNNALSCLHTMQVWEIVPKRFDTSGKFVFQGEKYTVNSFEKLYSENKQFRETVHVAMEKHFSEVFRGLPYGIEEEV